MASPERRFTGTYLHTLDDRGRIALPAKLRECLGDKVAVTNGFAPNTLVVYPEHTWEKFSDRLLEAPAVNEAANDARLYYFGNAWEGAIDNQGRIPLPDYMREFANLSNEVAVVGAGDHIVIWDRQEWIAKRAALRANRPVIDSLR